MGQIARAREQPQQFLGQFGLGTYESFTGHLQVGLPGDVQGDLPTGVIRSRIFRLTGNRIAFRIAGTLDIDRLYIALYTSDNGIERLRATGSGNNLEAMATRAWDVSPWLDERVFLEIADLSMTGHILGDLLDVQLRPGNAHTADSDLEFILPLLDQVEAKLCQVAAVRIDAGFPDEKLLAALEERRTPYVARLKNNAVLDRMAQPYLTRPVGRPPAEPRTWTVEMTYKAKGWSRERRVEKDLESWDSFMLQGPHPSR